MSPWSASDLGSKYGQETLESSSQLTFDEPLYRRCEDEKKGENKEKSGESKSMTIAVEAMGGLIRSNPCLLLV
jgi:hypothetical protein